MASKVICCVKYLMIFSTQLFSALYSSGETFFQFASWCKDSGNIARCFEERSVLINFFIKIGDKKKNQMMHVSNFWDVFSFREQFLMRDFKIKKCLIILAIKSTAAKTPKTTQENWRRGSERKVKDYLPMLFHSPLQFMRRNKHLISERRK